MSEPQRCLVAFAGARRQYLWPVELPRGASIAAALAQARARIGEHIDGEPIPWDTARVGIFGELRERGDPCAAGDRIELYRPLVHDPRARRRERLARTRRAAR